MAKPMDLHEIDRQAADLKAARAEAMRPLAEAVLSELEGFKAEGGAVERLQAIADQLPSGSERVAVSNFLSSVGHLRNVMTRAVS